jgi:hypothetical protein
MKVASDKFEKEYHIIRIDKNQIHVKYFESLNLTD